MSFDDFDLETQDIKDTDPEQFVAAVVTAGSPVTITPTNTRPITKAIVINPSKGPNANGVNDVLLVSIDGTTNYITIARGESISYPGVFPNISIDTNNNGTNYEVVVWS